MYSAGHILIMPKENWNNVTTYQILDAVRHDGKAYLSKINGNTNHTPSGSTDNYWFLFAEDGFTPSVTASKSGKDTTITYVNKSGSSTSHVFDGDDGVSVTGITKTGSQTVDGRVVDTYTVTYSNSTTSTFQVVNGKDGTGVGDMEKSVYDKDNNGIVDGVLGNTELIKDTVGFTSKNLIPFPYYESNVTHSGITYTQNSDGSITMNGTQSGATSTCMLIFKVPVSEIFELNTKYKFTSGNNNASHSWSRFGLMLRIDNADETDHVDLNYADGNEFIVPSNWFSNCFIKMQLFAVSGTTVTNQTFYPMLRKADIMDSTYEQYRKPVPQYIEDRIKDTVGWSSKNLFDGGISKSTYHASYTEIPNGYRVTSSDTQGWAGMKIQLDQNQLQHNTNYRVSCKFKKIDNNAVDGIQIRGGTVYMIYPDTLLDKHNQSSYEFEFNSGNYPYIELGLYATSGTGVANVSVEYTDIMIRLAEDLSPTYEQYNPSVKQILRNNKIIEGKNLLQNQLTNLTGNGITFTHNADESVTLNGTSTASTVGRTINNSISLEAGSYVFSQGVVNANASCFLQYDDGGTTKYVDLLNAQERGFTLATDKVVSCSISVRANGATINNVTFYPMIRKATETDPTYEQYYIPGVVSQEAQNVLGAKNRCNFYLNGTEGGTGITSTITDGVISLSGTASGAVYIVISDRTIKNQFAGMKLTDGGEIPSALNNKVNLRVRIETDGGSFVRSEVVPTNGSITIPTLEANQRYRIDILIADTANLGSGVTIKPMISFDGGEFAPYAMTNRELTEKVTRTEISNVDLNDITDPGIYYMMGGMTNTPGMNYGMLEVVNKHNYVRQIIYPEAGADKIYTRLRASGTWQSWYQFSGTVVS